MAATLLLPLLASSLLEDRNSASNITGRGVTVRLESAATLAVSDDASSTSEFLVAESILSSSWQTAAASVMVSLATRSAKPGHSGRRAADRRLNSTSVEAGVETGAERRRFADSIEHSPQTVDARCNLADDDDDDDDDDGITSGT